MLSTILGFIAPFAAAFLKATFAASSNDKLSESTV